MATVRDNRPTGGVIIEESAYGSGIVYIALDEIPDLIRQLTEFAQPSLVGAAYDKGYRDGESSNAADWVIALDDLLPDDVEAKPLQVAAWIERIEREQQPVDADDGPLTFTPSPEGFAGADQ